MGELLYDASGDVYGLRIRGAGVRSYQRITSSQVVDNSGRLIPRYHEPVRDGQESSGRKDDTL